METYKHTGGDRIVTGRTFTIGSGGMVETSVKAEDSKNNLPIGTVLQLNGYTNPRYVIVENQGIDDNFPAYGARYRLVNLDDFTFKTESAYEFDHISTKENDRIHMYYLDETLSPEAVLESVEKAEAKQLSDKAAADESLRIGNELEAKGRALFAKYIPKEAKALIVAELETDDCDLMTDYFNTKKSGLVILGWSKHTRDIFSEMRKHAGKLPETEHLALNPEGPDQSSDEHREKYSMGHGYYLKHSGCYTTGWTISKTKLYGDEWDRCTYIAMATRCIFEPEGQEDQPDAQEAPGSVEPEAATITVEAAKVQPADVLEAAPGPILREPAGPVTEPEVPPAPDKEPPTIGEYKGNPTISLPMGSRGFCFGKTKAAAILEYIDEIRDFVENN